MFAHLHVNTLFLKTIGEIVKHHNDMKAYVSSFVDDLFDAFTEEEHELCQKNAEKLAGDTVWLASMCTGCGLNDEIVKV